MRVQSRSALSAQLRKDVPADALISESHKFLLKVFAHLVQHDLLVVQFQLSLERVHIAEPEADEVVRNIVQAFPGTLWILFGDGNVLDNKTKVDQCFQVRRNSRSVLFHCHADLAQLVVAVRNRF